MTFIIHDNIGRIVVIVAAQVRFLMELSLEKTGIRFADGGWLEAKESIIEVQSMLDSALRGEE